MRSNHRSCAGKLSCHPRQTSSPTPGLTLCWGASSTSQQHATRDQPGDRSPMADPITNFITDIPAKERKWKNHTIDPFAKAWINAFENFKETMKAQKEADEAAQKLKFELAML